MNEEEEYPAYYYRYGAVEQTLVKRISGRRFEAIIVTINTHTPSFVQATKESGVASNVDLWLSGCPFVPGLPRLYEAIEATLQKINVLQQENKVLDGRLAVMESRRTTAGGRPRECFRTE